MFNIVLVEPEIPPNTGNIIRLCANTGCNLHLVHPLGFDMSEKQLRRAGLDYGDMTRVTHYDSYEHFTSATFVGATQANAVNQSATKQSASKDGEQSGSITSVCLSTKGNKNYHQHRFSKNEWLLFGSETRGLNSSILQSYSSEKILRLPMLASSRSLNLSNTVAIVVYEAWRQHEFSTKVIAS